MTNEVTPKALRWSSEPASVFRLAGTNSRRSDFRCAARVRGRPRVGDTRAVDVRGGWVPQRARSVVTRHAGYDAVAAVGVATTGFAPRWTARHCQQRTLPRGGRQCRSQSVGRSLPLCSPYRGTPVAQRLGSWSVRARARTAAGRVPAWLLLPVLHLFHSTPAAPAPPFARRLQDTCLHAAG